MKKLSLMTGLLFFIVFYCFSACIQQKTSNESAQNMPSKFANVLNIKNIPKAPKDGEAFCFFDQGAWHGFALPPDSATELYGGFPGPFLMTHWRWLSRCLAQLTMLDSETERPIDLSLANDVQSEYLPGLLRHQFSVNDLKVRMSLIFSSSQTALIRVEIENCAANPRQLRLGWQGDVWQAGTRIFQTESGVLIKLKDTEFQVMLTVPNQRESLVRVSDNQQKYQVEFPDPVSLEQRETITMVLAVSLFANAKEQQTAQKAVTLSFVNTDAPFAANNDRWTDYLRKILNLKNQWTQNPDDRRLAVKALLTLINNWKSHIGGLHHAGIIPSYNIHYFNGFWAWDSWKHAVALAKFAPILAKDQIRAMFDYQDEDGMIADCIFPDTSENNWRDTKPPLAAWAVWKVYQANGDEAFLAEMFPKLLRYHRWWYDFRDHDGNGLCEYGSTDGTLIAAKWESGMDNAVRFDDAKMLQNNPAGWSMNQESVDLNAYLYAEKNYLAKIASQLGEVAVHDQLLEEAGTLKTAIRQTFFDETSGFFYDVRLPDRSFIKIAGPEGWIALWANAATPEQAEQTRRVMLDSTKFSTYVPFPTVARNHPEFSQGYWRGPVWLDQAGFAVEALRNYGFNEDADRFTRQLFAHPAGLLNSDAPIRENYDALTGKGLNVKHFSWSAAHLLMLLWGE